MQVFVFDTIPYDHHFEEFKADRFIPYPLPRQYSDPEIAARTYADHLEMADIEANVENGTYHCGSAKEVTEQLIEVAEHAGANALLVNMDLGAVPHEMYLEQIRRFGREVLPRLQAHEVTRVPIAAARH